MRIGNRPHVVVYTDGGCDPNPGPGGWGAVLVYKLKTHELSGAERVTTNNRMELTAAIKALETLTKSCDVLLMTDSQYLRRGITEWLNDWVAHGWRKKDGQPVENIDLWKMLVKEASRHTVEWRWVKGHRGDVLNERADQLATVARQNLLSGQASTVIPAERKPTESSRLKGMPQITLVARGCALGVPGPAGYACVVKEGKKQELMAGHWPTASSNLMELWAVIKGLQSLQAISQVTIYSGSKYVLNGAQKWLSGWESNGWRTSSGKPVSNKETWLELIRAMGDHDITWRQLDDTILDLSREAASRARQEAESARDQT